MQDDRTKVPVYSKGEVAAYALVDEIDWLWARQYRWHLSEGYAARAQRKGGPKRPSVRIFMHREITGLKHGYQGKIVDHLNGESLDNRRVNLRVGTHAENCQNRKSHKGSTSKYSGVSWWAAYSVWRVQIMVNGHRTVVGIFDDEDEAGRAAAAFRRQHAPHSRGAVLDS